MFNAQTVYSKHNDINKYLRFLSENIRIMRTEIWLAV